MSSTSGQNELFSVPAKHVELCQEPSNREGQANGSVIPRNSSARIKDAGIAIRYSRGRILFYTAGSGNGLEGVDTVAFLGNGSTTNLKKTQFPSFFAGARPAKKDGKYRLAAAKIWKNAGFGL